MSDNAREKGRGHADAWQKKGDSFRLEETCQTIVTNGLGTDVALELRLMIDAVLPRKHQRAALLSSYILTIGTKDTVDA